MNLTFDKVEKYIGTKAYSSGAIQFDLPNVESFAKRYVTAYEIRKAKDILDAHYITLRTDLLYDFKETLSVFLETKKRNYITCSIKGFQGLDEIRNDWLIAIDMEKEYNELKDKGESNLDDLFKILYAKRDIEEELLHAISIIEKIETYIKKRLEEIKKIIEPLLK